MINLHDWAEGITGLTEGSVVKQHRPRASRGCLGLIEQALCPVVTVVLCHGFGRALRAVEDIFALHRAKWRLQKSMNFDKNRIFTNFLD